ncbi:MAG TPA: hypothetical protein VHC86_05785 [Opitutaceae bacterium]|nr:hypothetical protein [Opitutaceae bacterium]
MNTFLKTALGALLLAGAAFLAGCSTQSPKDSSIPWTRPASWENQVPGMGTGFEH